MKCQELCENEVGPEGKGESVEESTHFQFTDYYVIRCCTN